MHCEQTERLLDAYLEALAAFYDAHKPTLWRWLRGNSDLAAQAASKAHLCEASFNFWIAVEVYEPIAAAITRGTDLLTV